MSSPLTVVLVPLMASVGSQKCLDFDLKLRLDKYEGTRSIRYDEVLLFRHLYVNIKDICKTAI